jgi:hypothetical protein
MTLHRLSSLAVVAVLGLTACGGSSTPSSSAQKSPAATSPAPAPLTSPATTAAAAKINLTAADLPGFKASPADNSKDSAETKAEKGFDRCVGASTADPAADVTSDDFNKGTGLPMLTISSDVSFVTDPAVVKSDLAAFKGAKASGCVSTFFAEAVGQAASGVKFATPTVTPLSPAAPGGDGTFGFRVTSSASAGGQSIPVTFDILAFGKGRTEVSLNVIAVGTTVPDAQRDALFAKLVQRAGTNAL